MTPRYDPDRHHRRSIRLKGYDYGQVGAYFVTVCAYRREYVFGWLGLGWEGQCCFLCSPLPAGGW
jgi:hypothetical protein